MLFVILKMKICWKYNIQYRNHNGYIEIREFIMESWIEKFSQFENLIILEFNSKYVVTEIIMETKCREYRIQYIYNEIQNFVILKMWKM